MAASLVPLLWPSPVPLIPPGPLLVVFDVVVASAVAAVVAGLAGLLAWPLAR